MKQLKFILFLFFSPLLLIAQKRELPLEKGWQLQQVETNKKFSAELPGTVLSNLIRSQEVNYPTTMEWQEEIRWVEDADWTFHTSLEIDNSWLMMDHVELEFEALSGTAEVYLNDSLILTSNRSLFSRAIDVDGILRSGANDLVIYFHSQNKLDSIQQTHRLLTETRDEKTTTNTPNDNADNNADVDLANSWLNQISTTGVVQPVVLCGWNNASITRLQIRNQALSKEKVSVIVDAMIEATAPFVGELQLVLDGKVVKKSAVELQIGEQPLNLVYLIDDPQLWWPKESGEQKLYDLELILLRSSEVIDQVTKKHGIRAVETNVSDGRIQTQVNGKQFKIRGAVYTPNANLSNLADGDFHKKIVRSALEANLNTIWIWGSAAIENDEFYQLCDEMGLIVWQSLDWVSVGSTEEQKYHDEATNVMRKLADHPSINLWTIAHKTDLASANSETVALVPIWEYGKITAPENDELQIIDPTTGSPPFQTLKATWPEEDFTMESLTSRLRKTTEFSHNETYGKLSQELYPDPIDIESFVYLNHLMQGELLTAQIEQARMAPSQKTGLLVWNFNEQSHSLSNATTGIDGEPNALYHYLKRAMSPLKLVIKQESDEIKVHALNDAPEEARGNFLLELLDFKGKTLQTHEKNVRIKTADNRELIKLSMKELLKKQRSNEVYLRARILDEGLIVSESCHFFSAPKNLKLALPDIEYDFIEENGKLFIELNSPDFALGVYFQAGDLTVSFEDQYFVLHPNQTKRIEIYSAEPSFEIRNKLTVSSIATLMQP